MYGSRRVPVWRIAWRTVGALAVGLMALSNWRMPISAQQNRGQLTITSTSPGELRDWAPRIDSLRRSGELRLRTRRDDPLVAGRTHERYDQFHRGVRVFGADVAEQLRGGQVISAFGNVYEGIEIDTSPAIEADRARAIIAARAGVEIGRTPELVVLPRGDSYTLTWRVRAATTSDVREYFVDARDGSIAFEYSDFQTQSAVGRGQGVLGDTKKISVSSSGGQFVTTDRLRPPAINTYDMRGDFNRTLMYLNDVIQLSASDLGSDADNTWTDGATVDAHVYGGWTYDYYFKRFDRRGLDNRDIPLVNIVHPARRADFFQNFQTVPDFYLNAGYFGDGVMLYGEGLPAGFTSGGQTVDFFSAALDIVAHELTHGVTQYTSNLIYQNESGALNEAFSDIMGTSVEFYFQQPGSGNLRADYLMGEDVFRPGGIRSHVDPQAYGDPDHYSRRFTGTGDNGGVHINSGIANNAFYLAIESGTNRTSGLSVQGVGAANREQMERVFYRAFTQLLPANATFTVARAATIQAARDLYGANSAAERAVTQAWTAVGVN
jgi:bacillolysin